MKPPADASNSGHFRASGGVAALASPAPSGHKLRRRWQWLLGALAFYAALGLFHARLKPLPTHLSWQGDPHHLQAADVDFLYDLTSQSNGQRVSQQMIFDRVLQLIRNADDFVLVDAFLFNDFLGNERNVHRRLSGELSDALLQKKRSRPAIQMLVISDPVNEVYGGPVPEHIKAMRAAGIPVVLTDLSKLRDSNPAYSAFWRIFIQWLGNSPGGWLPHPFSRQAEHVSLRSWLGLLNFKANHRKLIVADAPGGTGGRQLVSIVMSANPHDASSAHGNVALRVRGGVWRDLVTTEQAILDFSGAKIDLAAWLPPYAHFAEPPRDPPTPSNAQVRVLTESKIRDGFLAAIGSMGSGDTLDLGMFYLSERRIVRALLDAANRGASIRLLLDPNRDAFGYEKGGIPNRPVAAELVRKGSGRITVRWSDTHGEQFHTKMLLAQGRDHATLIAGSANLTRRNIGDLNLETDLAITGPRDLPAIQAAAHYFERIWSNLDLACSLPFESYADRSWLKFWQYRLQEASGACTF